MRVLAAIRTHRWGAAEQKLLNSLQSFFKQDIVVVFHNRPSELDIGLPVVDLNDQWVAENGLRVLDDYGWRCGDYFYYALTQKYPDYDYYWLIEPDVWFKGDPVEFFKIFAQDGTDALGVHYAEPWSQHRFLKGVYGRPPMQAFFPMTRLSKKALDWLFTERQLYSRSRVRNFGFANDEMFVFSWLSSNPDMTVKGLEAVAPDWFAGTHFQSNPDILMRAVMAEHAAQGLYHPVRETASYCDETGRRIVGTQRLQNMLAPSLAHLTAEDADLIGASVARHLKALLMQGCADDS